MNVTFVADLETLKAVIQIVLIKTVELNCEKSRKHVAFGFSDSLLV